MENIKVKVLPIIIGLLGTISQSFKNRFKRMGKSKKNLLNGEGNPQEIVQMIESSFYWPTVYAKVRTCPWKWNT